MMNILKKFEINSSTYIFILLYFLCGFIKNIMVIYLIVIIHELGHVVMALLCRYKIKKVIIYPFGGITKTDTLLNSPLKKDLLVFCGGFIFQGFLYLLMILLKQNSIINLDFFNIFIKYNWFIFVFNLIPIIPLDGYLILNVLFNKFFSYYKSLWLSLIISIISLALFLYYYQDNYVIITFLLFNLMNYLKNINVLYNRFILERYLYDFSYHKIKYFNNIDLKKIPRECLCYFKNKNKFLSEKQILHKRFDNVSRIW